MKKRNKTKNNCKKQERAKCHNCKNNTKPKIHYEQFTRSKNKPHYPQPKSKTEQNKANSDKTTQPIYNSTIEAPTSTPTQSPTVKELTNETLTQTTMVKEPTNETLIQTPTVNELTIIPEIQMNQLATTPETQKQQGNPNENTSDLSFLSPSLVTNSRSSKLQSTPVPSHLSTPELTIDNDQPQKSEKATVL